MPAMNLIENAEEVILEPQRPARAAVIWLHGLGADGYDFVPMIPELELPADAAVRFIFPHAPVRPVTLNNGLPMRAWYDILGLDGTARADAEGIAASQQRLLGYLRQQRESSIAAARILLAGFSQGGAIVLHTGLRLPEAIGGLIALSTYLPLHERLAAEASAASKQAPLFMAHGRHDAIVPCSWGERSMQLIQAQGYEVQWQRYAMAHEVCDEEIGDLSRWLGARLAAAG